jgi:hypothetical protein
MIRLFLLPLMMMLGSPTMDVRSGKVIDLFVRVCLRGEAHFAKGDIQNVNSGSVPWPLSARVFNRPGKFYRVLRPIGAWVTVTEEGGDPDSRSLVCRVAADHVDVRGAANRIRAWLREPPLPGRQRLMHYEETYLGGDARFEVEHAAYNDLVILHSYVRKGGAADREARRSAR